MTKQLIDLKSTTKLLSLYVLSGSVVITDIPKGTIKVQGARLKQEGFLVKSEDKIKKKLKEKQMLINYDVLIKNFVDIYNKQLDEDVKQLNVILGKFYNSLNKIKNSKHLNRDFVIENMKKNKNNVEKFSKSIDSFKITKLTINDEKLLLKEVIDLNIFQSALLGLDLTLREIFENIINNMKQDVVLITRDIEVYGIEDEYHTEKVSTLPNLGKIYKYNQEKIKSGIMIRGW